MMKRRGKTIRPPWEIGPNLGKGRGKGFAISKELGGAALIPFSSSSVSVCKRHLGGILRNVAKCGARRGRKHVAGETGYSVEKMNKLENGQIKEAGKRKKNDWRNELKTSSGTLTPKWL